MTEDRGAAYRFRVFSVFRGSNLCVLCVLCGYHLHSYPALSSFPVYVVNLFLQLPERKRLDPKPLQRCLGDIALTAGRAKLFTRYEVACPIL